MSIFHVKTAPWVLGGGAADGMSVCHRLTKIRGGTFYYMRYSFHDDVTAKGLPPRSFIILHGRKIFKELSICFSFHKRHGLTLDWR